MKPVGLEIGTELRCTFEDLWWISVDNFAIDPMDDEIVIITPTGHYHVCFPDRLWELTYVVDRGDTLFFETAVDDTIKRAIENGSIT